MAAPLLRFPYWRDIPVGTGAPIAGSADTPPRLPGLGAHHRELRTPPTSEVPTPRIRSSTR